MTTLQIDIPLDRVDEWDEALETLDSLIENHMGEMPDDERAVLYAVIGTIQRAAIRGSETYEGPRAASRT